MNSRLSKYVLDFNNVWAEKCSNYNKLPNILPKVERIIVIGDIHGDIKVLLECLKKAKVIDSNVKWTGSFDSIEWIGGKTVIVQVGDQIDSCRYDGAKSCNNPNNYEPDEPDDLNILFFMTTLHNKAQKKGGAVYSLMGNHELMNVNGDLSYVSYSNIKHFSNYKTKDGEIIADGFTGRKHVFSPGNEIANFLACTRNITLIIGSNLFVHAGIVPYITKKYNVHELNMLLKLFLFDELKNPKMFNDIFMSSKHSPLWTRVFGNPLQTKDKCDELMTPLKEVYMVGKIYVGHTPQIKTGITSACDGKIWLTDAGMPSAFNKFDEKYINSKGKENSVSRQAQVLEILDDGEKITVLK